MVWQMPSTSLRSMATAAGPGVALDQLELRPEKVGEQHRVVLMAEPAPEPPTRSSRS